MKPIVLLQESYFNPQIEYHLEKHYLVISGFCGAEKNLLIQKSLIDWLTQNKNLYNNRITCVFNLVELSLSAEITLLTTLKQLKNTIKPVSHLHVIWQYKFYDDNMLSIGQNFAEILNISFEYSPQFNDWSDN